MSTAFLKEDAPDRKVFIPPRAPLPPNVTNLVTPRGLRLLQEEQARMEAERRRVMDEETDENERTRLLAELSGRLSELQPRLAGAKVIDVEDQPQDEVRFGATVTLKSDDGTERRLTLVGVDEAKASEGRIAFTAPIARLLLGRKKGEPITLRTTHATQAMTIQAIEYED